MEKSSARDASAHASAQLLEAIRSGNAAAAIRLLKAGANPDARDPSLGDISALGLACMLESNAGPVIARALVLHNVTIAASPLPESGVTSLMLAMESRRLDTMMILLAAGADINAPDLLGETALFRAIRSGYLDGVTLLVKQGASINSTNLLGESLHDAIAMASFEGSAMESFRKNVTLTLRANSAMPTTEPSSLKQAFSWIASQASARKTATPT